MLVYYWQCYVSMLIYTYILNYDDDDDDDNDDDDDDNDNVVSIIKYINMMISILI